MTRPIGGGGISMPGLLISSKTTRGSGRASGHFRSPSSSINGPRTSPGSMPTAITSKPRRRWGCPPLPGCCYSLASYSGEAGGSSEQLHAHGLERSLAIGLAAGLLASALHAAVDLGWSYPAVALLVGVEALMLLSLGPPTRRTVAEPRFLAHADLGPLRPSFSRCALVVALPRRHAVLCRILPKHREEVRWRSRNGAGHRGPSLGVAIESALLLAKVAACLRLRRPGGHGKQSARGGGRLPTRPV